MEEVFLLGMAPCAGCGRMFTFDPDRVPSIRLSADRKSIDPSAPRQPVCRTCWDERQTYRRANGLPEETLLPGAYEPGRQRSYGDV